MLFGSHIVSIRERYGVGQDVFASNALRSPEWISGVERGAIVPSPTGLKSLESGLLRLGFPIDDLDLESDLSRFESEPMSVDAQNLRAKYQLGRTPSDETLRDPDGLIPLLHDLRYQDRLLTLTPLTLLAFFVAVFALGAPWRGSGIKVDSPNIAIVTFVALGVIAFGSLLLPPINRLLAWFAESSRIGESRAWHRDARRTRDKENAVEPTGNWYVPGEEMYSTPEHRRMLKGMCLEADLYERLILVLATGDVLGVLSLVLAVNDSTQWRSWLSWLLATVALVCLTTLALIRRRSLARWIPVILRLSYGRQPSFPLQEVD
jgi:hypothetical protein